MSAHNVPQIYLELADGTRYEGISFGADKSAAGEVVFNTGMVGYPETLTDPSYRGQILVLTYPLIGNYGVPATLGNIIESPFESHQIQISGLVVSSVSGEFSHPRAVRSLSDWLKNSNIPAIAGVDTRQLTKRLREHGTILGRVVSEKNNIDFFDPDISNLVSDVSSKEKTLYESGGKHILLIDCGCKGNILRSLIKRGCAVTVVPWDYDFSAIDYDGILVSNGPGNPKRCDKTLANLSKALKLNKPVFGICLGNQLLALAAGGDTYKLKYGHRSQNQPCFEKGSKRCFITSQNHGYAVDDKKLPSGWVTWFVNANDGTNEGIRHKSKPFMSVQFHPEASPGPTDTDFLFDEFINML